MGVHTMFDAPMQFAWLFALVVGAVTALHGFSTKKGRLLLTVQKSRKGDRGEEKGRITLAPEDWPEFAEFLREHFGLRVPRLTKMLKGRGYGITPDGKVLLLPDRGEDGAESEDVTEQVFKGEDEPAVERAAPTQAAPRRRAGKGSEQPSAGQPDLSMMITAAVASAFKSDAFKDAVLGVLTEAGGE